MVNLILTALLVCFGAQAFANPIGDVEGTDSPFTLDKGNHGLLLGRLFEGAVLGLAADIGFIDLDNLARSTNGTG